MNTAQPKSHLTLSTPVQYVPGIGPDRAQFLQRLQLFTLADILFYLPRAYEPAAVLRKISELMPGQTASAITEVAEIDSRVSGSGKLMTGILFQDATGYLRGVWFNQPHVHQQFRRGNRVLVTGEPKRKGRGWEIVHPKCRILEADETVEELSGLLPVYGLTEGFSQGTARRCLQAAVERGASLVPEVLPSRIRDLHDLPGIEWSLKEIHRPKSNENLTRARHRFVFQEFLVQQLALLKYRHQRQLSLEAPQVKVDAQLDARIRRLFPFPLTQGQSRVIAEIVKDLGATAPMNRLLLGDVGSGKTAIAVYAMLAVAAHGYQAVLMAPTEVLARQHYETLTRLLAESRLRIALWTGSLSTSARKELIRAAGAGELDLVVGTPGITYGELAIPRLALVVIDEQHRFGVRQRGDLKGANQAPHCLLMTATPIPRSLAMIAYGDLSVSVLNETPQGRQPIHTYLVTEEQREAWWEFYRRQLQSGRQGFVIVPRVGKVDQELEASEVATLESSFEALCHGELEAFRLDLIHGKLSNEMQQTAMLRFRSGETQVLVATSLIEIGLDVPNAAVMTIENAERFGLAQLHQMRGRVGRGAHPGYVALMAGARNDLAQERLKILTSANDGFTLAELDLKQRGPGDFLGVRQHGMPNFRVARLPDDQQVLSQARSAAEEILRNDEKLSAPDLVGLAKQVAVRYDERAALGDVG